ncbi:MAG TPA: hypothetical protein VGF17_24565 [Phytomonospora sp.]
MSDLELTFGGGSRGAYQITVDDTDVEIIFDSTVGPDSVEATVWVDDENGDPLQLNTLRLTAVVIA